MTDNIAPIQKIKNHPVNSNRTGKPVCPECGMRIRGKLANHEAGEHHKSKGKYFKK